MTDNATETRTIQNYRHEARGVLTQAREALALRTDATRSIYTLLNGSIESLLNGQPGFSVEEQVAHLLGAASQAEENRAKVAEAVEAAKAEIIAQIDAWDFDSALAQTAALLNEAADFAATRDFDAHQAEKSKARSYDSFGGTDSYDAEGDAEQE